MSEPRPTVDLGYPTEPYGRIPAFDSIEEEAAFWDTHDVTDFLDVSCAADLTIGKALADRLDHSRYRHYDARLDRERVIEAEQAEGGAGGEGVS